MGCKEGRGGQRVQSCAQQVVAGRMQRALLRVCLLQSNGVSCICTTRPCELAHACDFMRLQLGGRVVVGGVAWCYAQLAPAAAVVCGRATGNFVKQDPPAEGNMLAVWQVRTAVLRAWCAVAIVVVNPWAIFLGSPLVRVRRSSISYLHYWCVQDNQLVHASLS